MKISKLTQFTVLFFLSILLLAAGVNFLQAVFQALFSSIESKIFTAKICISALVGIVALRAMLTIEKA